MTHQHYRLTSDEFLDINSQLTAAQLRVYLHYKTLDPFGDRRIEVCTKAIASKLGVTQRTVQRCLNKLVSLGLLAWQKAKSFVMRHQDRQGDIRIAKATSGSPRRHQCRERQLELNLGAGSEVSQSSSVFFNLNQLDQEEIFDFEDVENLDIDVDSEISVEDAIAEIRKALPHEYLLLNNEDEVEQEIEENLEPKTDLQLTNVGNTNGTSEGKPSRAAVEQFVLKTLNKTFPNAARCAAYFAKFDSKSWKKWETDYKASLTPQAAYKPYIPEKVEVAPPNSPVVLSALAQMKKTLGIKG